MRNGARGCNHADRFVRGAATVNSYAIVAVVAVTVGVVLLPVIAAAVGVVVVLAVPSLLLRALDNGGRDAVPIEPPAR